MEGQGHPARKEDAQAVFDAQLRKQHPFARVDDDVAQIEVIGGNVHRDEGVEAIRALKRELTGQEPEHVAASLLVHEDDALEAGTRYQERRQRPVA